MRITDLDILQDSEQCTVHPYLKISYIARYREYLSREDVFAAPFNLYRYPIMSNGGDNYSRVKMFR